MAYEAIFPANFGSCLVDFEVYDCWSSRFSRFAASQLGRPEHQTGYDACSQEGKRLACCASWRWQPHLSSRLS